MPIYVSGEKLPLFHRRNSDFSRCEGALGPHIRDRTYEMISPSQVNTKQSLDFIEPQRDPMPESPWDHAKA